MFLHDASPGFPRPLKQALVALGLAVLAMLPVASLAADAPATQGDPMPKGLQLLLPDSTQAKSAQFLSLRKYALIVGIDQYDNRDQGITPLRYAVGDAQSVYRALVDSLRGGFKPEDVTLLTDSTAQKPTSTAIGRALNKLILQTHEDDLVLIYFSGHGYEEEGRAYLLPANADLAALDYSAIERDAFVRQIDKIPAKKVIVVLDACHSGGVNRGGKGVGRDAALSTKYYDSFSGSQGRAFIASSSGGELSWEDEESHHGVFTQSLVQALSGAADTEPADGVVSLHEVQRYLEGSVSDWASRRGKSQHPQVNLESSRGDMPIAINYAFLADQSKDLTDRRDLASHVRTGLTNIEGLTPDEVARSVDAVNRYGRAETMSDSDSLLFSFAEKLVDGAIDVQMFRTGVAQTMQLVTPAQVGLAPRKSSFWTNKWFLGGLGVVVGGAAAAAGGGGGGGAHAATPIGPPPPPPSN